MPAFTPPASMRRLLDAALTHGRSYVVQHQTDNGDCPLVTVKVQWPGPDDYQPNRVEATWHTRGTGTYRLTHAAGTWARCDHAQLSLARALEFVTGTWVPQEVQDLATDYAAP
ncbi:hypothetical protein [Nocardiopsis tropica]|uniref:Uncharacterized protein n=1 Tax=Nocardiopsis tropica TaxID=109330 RepID=A0ABU7KZS4_9ACTN|nr:hypothetical protein [Nocardiopsis umidischolae]MEE2054770.1 hypothetical protein [Nocardiopsis umidischolae]